jgi:hypothetical protein
MLQVDNETAFSSHGAMLLDRQGNKVWVVMVKGTFTLHADGHTSLSREQEPVVLAPQFIGNAGTSTLVREVEVAVDHPGTSVTINGSAYSPGANSVYEVDVGFEIGPIRKYLHVTGDRQWILHRNHLVISSPAPFQTMPLTYERAFGGRHQFSNGTIEAFSRNPAGAGFAPSPDLLVHRAVPNIEYAHDRVNGPGSRPAPAGLCAIPGSWSPRRELAGTFDDRWRMERSPLWPVDYDPRYQLSASWDQVSADPLRGGETVLLRNLTPGGVLQFRLPVFYFDFETFLRSSRVHHRGQLDRVIIEPDSHKLVMVWRSILNCTTDARAVKTTVISTKRMLA